MKLLHPFPVSSILQGHSCTLYSQTGDSVGVGTSTQVPLSSILPLGHVQTGPLGLRRHNHSHFFLSHGLVTKNTEEQCVFNCQIMLSNPSVKNKFTQNKARYIHCLRDFSPDLLSGCLYGWYKTRSVAWFIPVVRCSTELLPNLLTRKTKLLW